MSGAHPVTGCILDEARFFDSASGEWGYAVICVAAHDCGHHREMFRQPEFAVGPPPVP